MELSMKNVEITPLVECSFGLDGGAMFGIIPKPLWERTNPADSGNRIDMATRCLVMRVDERVILVDAGMGTKWDDKSKRIYKVAHAAGTLVEQLAAIDLTPDDITDVLITHMHFDHIGGLTEHAEDGSLRPIFNRATHWVQRENWAWAHSPSLRDAGSYRRENFEPLVGPKGVDLRLIDGVSTLFDAIEVIPTRGHTPGMQILKFKVEEQTVVYVADLIPTRGHLQLAYVMGYDVYPLTTVSEKHELLENAVNNDWIIAFEHDPEHGFARVERTRPDRYAITQSADDLGDLLKDA